MPRYEMISPVVITFSTTVERDDIVEAVKDVAQAFAQVEEWYTGSVGVEQTGTDHPEVKVMTWITERQPVTLRLLEEK